MDGPAALVTLGGAEDWALWRDARLAALAESPDSFPGAAAEWTEGGERRWRTRLLDPTALTIVAVLGGKPVGLVRGVPDDGATWLHSLWVSPHLRGHGLGERLVDAVENWARPRTAVVRLSVVAANARAIALYRRHGFVERAAPADGARELVMEKALARTHPVRPAAAPR